MKHSTIISFALLLYILSAPAVAQNIPGADDSKKSEEEQDADRFIPGETDDEEEEPEEDQDQEDRTSEPDQKRDRAKKREDEPSEDQAGPEQLEQDVPPGVEWSYVLSSNAKYQNVTGREQQSSLDEDYTAYATHDLKVEQTLEDDQELGLETSIRTSDDPRADSDALSVNRLQARYQQPHHRIVAGDYGVSFSNYSLTRSLKGVSYDYEQENSRFRLLGGTDKPEWKMAVERTENEPRDRVFQGARYEQDLFDNNVKAGVSLAHSRDHFEGTNRSGSKTENWNSAVDASWNITDSVNASGELAWSSFEDDVNTGQRKSDLAGIVRLNYNQEDVRANAIYEAVGRDFETASGSGSPGTRRFLTDGRWRAIDILTLNGGVSYNDNQLPGTGESKQTYGGFSLQNIDYFPGWRLDERLTLRKDEPGRSSTTTRTVTNNLTMSNTFMGMRGALSYDATRVEVHPQGNQGSRTDTISANAGAPLSFIVPDASVGLNLSRQITENRSTGEKDIIDRVSSNMRVPIRVNLRMNLRYGLSLRQSGSGQDTNTNRYGFDLEYDLPDPWDAFASLNVDHRDNHFDGTTTDYAETTVGVSFNLRLQ